MIIFNPSSYFKVLSLIIFNPSSYCRTELQGLYIKRISQNQSTERKMGFDFSYPYTILVVVIHIADLGFLKLVLSSLSNAASYLI
jgi:hypothetical protein